MIMAGWADQGQHQQTSRTCLPCLSWYVVVGRSVATRIDSGFAASGRDHVNIRVVRRIIWRTRADFQYERVIGGSVLQTMTVVFPSDESGRIAEFAAFARATWEIKWCWIQRPDNSGYIRCINSPCHGNAPLLYAANRDER
jgi:hypothetical protein